MDMDPNQQPPPQADGGRKRKADAQDNERLSKRLSLLNIEQDGTKLYVPVESPSPSPKPTPGAADHDDDDSMRIDDSKHKVYIYSIDEELADDSDADDEGRLVFLPDIEKRLKETRIPPHVLANSDGELAGMQVVLYSDPRSLTVPEEKDGVRKAILEARRRIRARQAGAQDEDAAPTTSSTVDAVPVSDASGQSATEDLSMDID